MITTKPKARKASAPGTRITPKMMELAAKIDKACGSTTTFFSSSAPKTGKAPAANGADPIFAAIAEHKMLSRESGRREDSFRAAHDEAEEKYGGRIRKPNPGEWPGEATVSPLYDRWISAGRAASKAAMRMARTKPTTAAGAAAMITHARRAIETGSLEDWEDWTPTALKTVAAALAEWALAS